jgi:hypothetical protein
MSIVEAAMRVVFEAISTGLDSRDIASWANTNMVFRRVAEDMTTSRLRTLLYRFVSDPEELRFMLSRFRSIISGSSALWLLDRGATWLPADLDIYCTTGNCASVLLYFECAQGYCRVAGPPTHFESMHGYGCSNLTTTHYRLDTVPSSMLSVTRD